MKSSLLTAAAFVASLAAAPVLAQPDQQHGEHGGGPPAGGDHHAGGPQGAGGPHEGGAHGPSGAPHQAGGPQHGGAPGGGGPHPMAASPAPQVHTETHPAVASPAGHDTHQRGGGDNHQGWTGNNPGAGRDAHQDHNGPGPGAQGHGPSHNQPFARGSATAHGGHFNFQGRNFNRAHAPAYRYPHGYGYRRWSEGSRLPRLFLSQSYFFTDYSIFGFGPPPYGDQWVRYGPDLLLVDIQSGEVVYVIYGAFY